MDTTNNSGIILIVCIMHIITDHLPVVFSAGREEESCTRSAGVRVPVATAPTATVARLPQAPDREQDYTDYHSSS